MTEPLPVALPISHVGLSVPDIDAALAWYCDVLGFTLLAGPSDVDDNSPIADTARDVYGPRWRAMRQAHLAAGNGTGLELFQFVQPPESSLDPPSTRTAHNPGLFHLCITYRDLPGLVRRIVEHGGKQTSAIHRPSPRYQLCYCADPWGNPVEINDISYEQAHTAG